MAQEIYDFSDLGNDVKFKIGETIYIIPPISREKARKLYQLSKELKSKSDKRDILEADIKKKKEEGQEVEEIDFIDQQIDDLKTFQNRFIMQAVENVTEEELEKWSARIIKRVVSLINDIVSGDFDEEKKV
jgi:hypothetical protein